MSGDGSENAADSKGKGKKGPSTAMSGDGSQNAADSKGKGKGGKDKSQNASAAAPADAAADKGKGKDKSKAGGKKGGKAKQAVGPTLTPEELDSLRGEVGPQAEAGKGLSLSSSDGPEPAAPRGGLITKAQTAEVSAIIREVCERLVPEQLAEILQSLPKKGPPQTGTGAAATTAQWATQSAQPSVPAADGAPVYTQFCGGEETTPSQPPPSSLNQNQRMPDLNQAMGADGLLCPICGKFVRGGRSALNTHQLTSSMCRAARGEQACGREPCQYCGKMLAADDEWAREQHAAFCSGQPQQCRHGPAASSWRPKGGPPAANSVPS
eukprot:s156_g13.t1